MRKHLVSIFFLLEVVISWGQVVTLTNRHVVPYGINLDTYFNVINLQSDRSDRFTLASTSVTQWNDISGNNYHATQSTSGQKPTYNSSTGVSFDGTDDNLVLPSEISLPTNFTIFIVFKNNSNGSSNGSALCGADTDNNRIVYKNTGDLTTVVSNGAEQGNDMLGSIGFYKILTIRKSGTTWTFKVNDRTMTLSSSTNTLSNGSPKIKTIGYASNLSGYCEGSISAFMAHSSALSDLEVTSVTTLLMARYNVAGNSDVSIVGFGDSITQLWSSYHVLDNVSTNLGIPFINCGYTGTKLSNASGSAYNGQDRYASTVITRPYKDKIYIMFGANDIGDVSISSSQFQSAMDAVVVGLINAGYSNRQIVVCSPTYRKDYLTVQTKTDAFRTAAQTVATNRGTRYADVLQAILNTGTPDTYMVDNLHPTSAGGAIIATTISNAFSGATLFRPTDNIRLILNDKTNEMKEAA